MRTSIAIALMLSLAGADFAMGASDGWVLRPALAGGLLLSSASPWLAPLIRSFARTR